MWDDVRGNLKYPFFFTGGTWNRGPIIKFFLFVKAFDSELFLSDAVAKGYVKRSQAAGNFSTDVNYLKIFYKESGFGSEYLYQSFFFKLQEDAKFEYTIRPHDCWRFMAKGSFMSDAEIREHFSSAEPKDSYFYYRRQVALSQVTIDRMISSKALAPEGIVVDQNEDFRMIR